MHRYPQNQSYVGSSGQPLTPNVSMTLCNWQIRHQTHVFVAALHLYRIKLRTKSIRPYAHCSLDKGVAITRGPGYERRQSRPQPDLACSAKAAEPHPSLTSSFKI